MMDIPISFHLWAKTDREGGGAVHPLLYHLIDVGECTHALWKLTLSEQTRLQFAGILGLEMEETGQALSFWSSLHDIGKAAPGFQRKYPSAMSWLKEAGFSFPNPNPKPAPHGHISAWALEMLFAEKLGYPRGIAKSIARAIGGHHGIWPSPTETQAVDRAQSDKGDGTWDLARTELFKALQDVFSPPTKINFPDDPQTINVFVTLLSGLVSVADWIGSMSEYFVFEPQYREPQEYSRHSAEQARKALEELGWIGWQADGQFNTFMQMFSFTPRDSQQAAFEAAEKAEQPALLIIEAPTGSGKTETALYLADTWLQANKGRGIYIAMPTKATSNQMFERVQRFLSRRYPEETINYHLIHGDALLAEKENDLIIQNIHDEDALQIGSIRAQAWFLPRKRTLLAPFGVGTVDQALMSVLQTKHFFVRLFGLGQKVLIFDEIHAYDTYMSTLFEHLLAWLRSVGTSAILLSATLPDQSRQGLVSAWLGNGQENAPSTEYPRLTLVTDDSVQVIPLPKPAPRSLAISWIDSDLSCLTSELEYRLREGGCAAVICNRVARAQEIYRSVQLANIVEPENLILFHARFPFVWREGIEKRVLEKFSKGGDRPLKAIVIATQVIEQSLDLDFDYMISDLAPIDLLLQRAGRLHRHSENNASRPFSLKEPILAIARPTIGDRVPNFGLDERVYEPVVLLRTWTVLNGKSNIIIPQEISKLIEDVYGAKAIPADPDLADAIKIAEEKAHRGSIEEIAQALKRLIPKPDDEDLLGCRNEGLEEDDPKVRDTFRALTRLADPGVSLVCLHQIGAEVGFEPDGKGGIVNLQTAPNREETREFLRHVVNVQRFDVVDYFVKQGENPAWKEIAALRYHYPVVFDKKGTFPLKCKSLSLILNRETGLEIRKESE